MGDQRHTNIAHIELHPTLY